MDNPLRPGERVMDRIAGFAREISRKVAEEVQKLRDQPAQLDDGGIGGIPFQRNLVQQVAASDVPLEVRLQRFRQVLAADRIDMDELRRLAMGGVPTQEGMRAVTWKLLLNYLPRQTSQWEAELKRKRDQYQQFCDELIIDPKTTASSSSSAAAAAAAGAGASSSGGGDVTSCHPLQAQDVTQDDHPLSLNHGSRWLEYFKDSETLQQIQRDVIRTHPDIEFFCGEGPDAAEHRDHMQRALFIYAKLNAGLRYIQGMNEIYALLYYFFRTDPSSSSGGSSGGGGGNAAHWAEADAFWCFMDLVSEFRDHFCQQLDDSSSGIRATIRRLMLMLQRQDYSLWQHVELGCKVDPQFFAFRWITLLLAQEFDFGSVARVWDALLADPAGRMDALLRVCTSMVLLLREELLRSDFARCLTLLQRYPPAVDVGIILQRAMGLPREDGTMPGAASGGGGGGAGADAAAGSSGGPLEAGVVSEPAVLRGGSGPTATAEQLGGGSLGPLG